MKRRMITLPELGLIAGTRALLGAGIGLLVADRLDRNVRRAVGWTLFAVGALSTIPLATLVVFRDERWQARGNGKAHPVPAEAEDVETAARADA